MFLFKAGNFRQTFNYLSQHIDPEELRQIFIQNPLLLSVDFSNFLMKKFKFFKSLRFTQTETIEFFKLYPKIFIR